MINKNTTILFEEEFYDNRCNKNWLIVELKNSKIELYKYGYGLHQSPCGILIDLMNEGKIKDLEYIGCTRGRREYLFKHKDVYYKMTDGWHCNSESRATLEKYKGKYAWVDNFYEEKLVEIQ